MQFVGIQIYFLLAMDELPYIQDTFNHVTEKSALEMYNKIMAQPKPFLSLFTGLNLVKKGTLAFNTDGVYAYAILKSECNATPASI